jgi:hypothetical protein
MTTQPQQKDDLKPYRKFGLTLLQLMALLVVVGLVGEVLVNYFF